MEEDVGSSKRKRGLDEPEESPDGKHLRADFLLDILEEVDSVDRNPAIGDLDNVMKSFEEEIAVITKANEVISDFSTTSTSGSDGPTQAELGYLLEASDDELGLPPTIFSSSDEGDANDELGRGTEEDLKPQIWEFDDEIPNGYDSLDVVFLDEKVGGDEGAVVDLGLFDHTLVQSEPSDFSDWLQDSLPAVCSLDSF